MDISEVKEESSLLSFDSEAVLLQPIAWSVRVWDSGLEANLQHARARANTHMYSTHASCASLAEWQQDYCMQSLHYSTALKGKKRESTDER